MKLLLFEKTEIHPSAVELLRKHEFTIFEPTDPSLPKKDIQAIFIRTYTQINQDLLSEYPGLKYVIRAGVGLENIDLKTCETRGIKVFNSPGSNANAVAELVMCFMLMLIRNITPQMQSLRHGDWRSQYLMGSEIKDKTIGFLGCGAIGKNLALKLTNFGVKELLGYDPYLTQEQIAPFGFKKCEIPDILKNADLITLHLPLNNETKNLITKKEFKQMKKNCYIINTSRGGIINEVDLIDTLKQKKIAGAALDVYETEPDIKKEFLDLKNLLLTPHIGGFTREANRAMSIQAIENFLKYLTSLRETHDSA